MNKFILKQYIKMIVQYVILPVWYRIGCLRPIQKGLIVFADAHHNQRPESMNLLCESLSKTAGSGLQIRELYLDYQRSSMAAVIRHMFTFTRLYARAEYVVICDNFLPAASCRKRKGSEVIQLWHACGALKKFGYDTAEDIPRQYRGNVFRNTDLVTVSAKDCVKPFASAMRLPEKCVRPLGVSRTDIYFQEEWRESCRREFERSYPEAAGKKVALWAPTFRGNPGNPRLPHLDVKRLQLQLGEDWLVLERVHPHMHEEYRDTDCRIPTDRMFPVVDVLIADYSSLIYEYLLFDKPLVLYVPDLEEYRARRGFYHDFREIPGRQVTEESALSEILRQECLAYSNDNMYNKILENNDRKRFIEKYMEKCDGHATDRIVDYIRKGRGI